MKITNKLLSLCPVALLLTGSLMFASVVQANLPDAVSSQIKYDMDGHYTEEYLKDSFLPNKLRQYTFPVKYSNDVTLLKITVGPGSTVSNYFDISEEFSKEQTISGLVKYVCSNKRLREQMVDKLENYKFIYSVGGEYRYTANVNTQNCESFNL